MEVVGDSWEAGEVEDESVDGIDGNEHSAEDGLVLQARCSHPSEA